MSSSTTTTQSLDLIERSIKRISITSRNEFFSLGQTAAAAGRSSAATTTFRFPTFSYHSSSSRGDQPTTTTKKTKKRDQLIVCVQKWIEKSCRKFNQHQQKQQKRPEVHHRAGIVKFLKSSPEVNGKDDPQHRALLDDYVRRIQNSNKINDSDTTKATSPPPPPPEAEATNDTTNNISSNPEGDNNEMMMGCSLVVQERTSQSSSLTFYHPPDGILFEGEVVSSSTSSNDRTAAILHCAARLYYRLWYFRTIHSCTNMTRAYGFVISASTSADDGGLEGTLLVLEKPKTGPIGCPYNLYEYTITTTTQQQQKNNGASSSYSFWDDLGYFLFQQPSSRINPMLLCNNNNHLNRTTTMTTSMSSPGYMLLPSKHPVFRLPSSSSPSSEAVKDEQCQVIPTITGSLVIRCNNSETVLKLLKEDISAMNEDRGGGEEDVSRMKSFIENFEGVATHPPQQQQQRQKIDEAEQDSNDSSAQQPNDDTNDNDTDGDDVWYVKYKTPPFGMFWDTANVAINATRDRLLKRRRQQQQKQRKQSTTPKTACDNDASDRRESVIDSWLHIHPIDSYISKNRSITIMRSVGKYKLSSVLKNWAKDNNDGDNSSSNRKPPRMSWKEFGKEYLSLMNRTLQFQEISNLIHGDINEGNIIVDYLRSRSSSKARNKRGQQIGWKLHLIDWDEALRQNPCHRKVTTTEERYRYPIELIQYPQEYTKQQFLHLYYTLEKKYNNNSSVNFNNTTQHNNHKGADDNNKNSHSNDKLDGEEELDNSNTLTSISPDACTSTVLSRKSVNARYKVLVQLLCLSPRTSRGDADDDDVVTMVGGGST